MTTPVIIDIVVAAVLLGFAVYGGKRGLFRALSGLLAVVVALVGAGIIAATFTTPVTKIVTPLIAGHIEEKVENAMAVQSADSGVQMPEADTEDPSAIQDLLAILVWMTRSEAVWRRRYRKRSAIPAHPLPRRWWRAWPGRSFTGLCTSSLSRCCCF